MTNRGVSLFLVLACIFVSTIASAKEKGNHHLPVVHVTNALPKNSEPMRLQCSGEEIILNAGEDYQWTLEENKLVYCEAFWGRSFASWHAFQPGRDVGRGAIYWLVKDTGFFLSWDNRSWVRKQLWETE
ncbi:hypothetical protein CIPAW_16G074900 [Carya illinoinensis]|uniref:Plant self-incompatibility S1 n=1 Tax=Carya illinoinensis TaxID=32201 RepID=A0A8T1N7J1_CARIL|nr:hypothetical protein CIPAW_16G074900 [Carya illinoinensis]